MNGSLFFNAIETDWGQKKKNAFNVRHAFKCLKADFQFTTFTEIIIFTEISTHRLQVPSCKRFYRPINPVLYKTKDATVDSLNFPNRSVHKDKELEYYLPSLTCRFYALPSNQNYSIAAKI